MLWVNGAQSGRLNPMVKRQFHLQFTAVAHMIAALHRLYSVCLINTRYNSGFLREDEVLNHSFFYRTPANVPDALADIVTHDHVIRV
jgi:hypothetical protein